MQRPSTRPLQVPSLIVAALAFSMALPLNAQYTTDYTVDMWTAPDFEIINGLRTFDVEGDGDQDIFLCRYNQSVQGNFSWYENTGLGVFAPPVTLHSADQSFPDVARDFDLADADADGDLDLVYVTELSSDIHMRTFDAGAFGPPEVWGTLPQNGVFIRWMQLDPWNDQLPDLVVHVETNHPHGIMNLGGAFGTPFVIGPGQVGLGPDYLEVGDFTGNYGDFLTYGATHLYLYSQLSDGEGGYYWDQTDLGVYNWPFQVIDVDGDGDDDIGMANNGAGWLRSPGLHTPLQYELLAPPSSLGVFGNVDCDRYVDLFSLLDPGLNEPAVSNGYDNDGLIVLEPPSLATGLPGTGRFPPVLVDLDEDGLNDLLLITGSSLHWYTNDGPAPEPVTLPPLDTLCANSSGYVLPAAQPPGGTWAGQGVDNGVFSAAGLGTGDLPILYEAFDAGQCPVTGTTAVHVVQSPSLTSTPDTWSQCSFIPIQFYGSPSGGEWIGLADANGAVQLTPGLSGAVQYSYTDPTGGNCMVGGVINMSYPSEPNIGYSGPYCLNAQVYQVIPVIVGNPGNISIYSWVDSVNFITPGVANIYYLADTLGLDTIIIGSSRPGFCGGIDTLIIEVVAPPEVTLSAFTDTLANTCGNLYALSGGLPASGVYSGDGVTAGDFAPAGLLGDVDITYTYTDGNGCSGSATQSIHVIDGISVTPNSVQQCVSDVPIQLTVVPQPEVWFDAIVSSANVLNTAQPFSGSVYCAWTDVTGCQLFGTLGVQLSAYSEGSVTTAEPVPGQVCLSTAAFDITLSLSDGTEETISFDPATEGLGDYQYIGVAVDDGSGCLRNDTLSFSVVDAPLVELAPFSDTLLATCETSTYLLTQGLPEGGIYSGDGVTDGYFHPYGLGGSNAITYTYSLGTGCEGTAVGVLETISNLAADPFGPFETIVRCVGDDPIQMVSYPTGQVWTGAAITPEGYIDMSAPYTGAISFVYTDAAECSDSLSIGTFIGAYILGTVSIPPGNEVVCVDAPAFTISWSTSDGVGADSLFDPAMSGPGVYAFIGEGVIEPGPTQCYQDVTATVEVVDAPVVTLDLNTGPLYNDGLPIALTGGTPAGGTYSGDNVTDGQFDPAAAEYGWHVITYTIAEGTCSGEAIDSVFVDSGTGLGTPLGATALHAWPVPAQDLLQVALPAHASPVVLVLFDARGRETLRTQAPPAPTGRTIQLQTSSIANGTYTLFARGLSNTAPARIIIAR